VCGPTAVAPANQFDRFISLMHFAREFDRGGNCLIFLEAGVPVRSFVPKLPELDVERLRVTMTSSFGVLGVICVRNPISGFLGIPGSIAFARLRVAFVAIAHEIDAVERLRANSPAQANEFGSADAIGFFATPYVIPHCRTTLDRANAFAPFVISAE